MNYKDMITNLKDITKLGDIKKLAKEIKIDHNAAIQLWALKDFHPRLLAVLIFDKKQIEEDFIIELANGLQDNIPKERDQISDWLLANQLMKDKKLSQMMLTWRTHEHPILRRYFWYYQARLRWTGKTAFDNTESLLDYVTTDMKDESPEVQWAMNYLVGQIGIFVPELRARCIKIGEDNGLYKGDKVSKGCTPAYLPEFISIEVEKRNK